MSYRGMHDSRGQTTKTALSDKLGPRHGQHAARHCRGQSWLEAELAIVLRLDAFEALQNAEEGICKLGKSKLLANTYPRTTTERRILPPGTMC